MDTIYLILGAVAAGIFGWVSAKRQGRKEERAAQAQQTLTEVRKAQEKVRDAKDKLNKMDDAAIRTHAASRLPNNTDKR